MAFYLACTLFVLPLTVTRDVFAVPLCNSSSTDWQPRVGTLLSPIISGSRIREIEVYWNSVLFEPGDTVSLYVDDPSGTPRVKYTITPDGPSGRERTGVQAEFIPSSDLSFVQECLKYGVVWMKSGEIKEKNCHKTQPTWMKERQSILGPLRIAQIFLPGTHDSASYDEDARKQNIVTKFAVTQDLDILGQLIHGVRYLDIRVGHYPNTDQKFWTNHGPFYRSVPLKTVTDQVKRFLENTEEIVIMDVREFPIGFNNLSDHRALVSRLENELRDHYLADNRGWGITLNDIWSTGRRLIIGYENAKIVEDYASMWPCVTHQWGNVRTVQDLYEYLSRIETNDRTNRLRPRSAMAELTATLNDIIFNRLGGLRDMAYRVNLNVTNWYSTVWQYSANIVAVDFLRGTDIVEIAIKSNENRHLYCR